MAVSTYALVSLTETKEHLGVPGTQKDTALEGIIDRISAEIEQFLRRQIVTRGALTEYHTLQAQGSLVERSVIRTLERPIISITTVCEDTATPRTYGASTELVAGTGYELVKPKGLIRRIDGAGTLKCWATGHRAIRVVYTAGYATTAVVPANIKAVALRYAALVWGEEKRGDFGVSGASDQLGNYTRFAPAQLTPEMKSALLPEARRSFWESGERDT